MAEYLIVLTDVERSTVLSALEKSTIYGAYAKDFTALLDKLSDAATLRSRMEDAEEKDDYREGRG